MCAMFSDGQILVPHYGCRPGLRVLYNVDLPCLKSNGPNGGVLYGLIFVSRQVLLAVDFCFYGREEPYVSSLSMGNQNPPQISLIFHFSW